MRHRKHKSPLGVKTAHRKALLANLAVALIEHGSIRTTLAKAKSLRPFVEKIITLAKKAKKASPESAIHLRRVAVARLRNKAAVKKLFDETVNQFTDRPGGYTRIYKLGTRTGDAAEMALIQLIDADDEGYKARSKRKASPKPDELASKEVIDVVATAEVEDTQSEPKDNTEPEAHSQQTDVEVNTDSTEEEKVSGEASAEATSEVEDSTQAQDAEEKGKEG